MKKLRIGYSPISKNLNAPGDRRRLAYWADKRGHQIQVDDFSNVDLIVLSEKSNLAKNLYSETDTPIVFDLVDGYLEAESRAKDYLRGCLKVLSGQVSGPPQKFSETVGEMCGRANVVICSSVEQRELISKYTKNCHIILDFHEEIPDLPFKDLEYSTKKKFELIWEGQPATLEGFQSINKHLEGQLLSNSGKLNLVTDYFYYRLLGRYWPNSTEALVSRMFPNSLNNIEILPWSIDNLVKSSLHARGALIPLDTDNRIQMLKPENRLLVMWKLGIPTLTSSIPSYMRIESNTALNFTCKNNSDWNEKIHTLLSDKDFAAEQVKVGKDYLKENHTEEVLLNKWDVAIKSIL